LNALLFRMWRQSLFGPCRGPPGRVEVFEIWKACEYFHHNQGHLPTEVRPRPDRDLPPDEARSRRVIQELLKPRSSGGPWLDTLDAKPDGTLLDPWGRQYLIVFDDNGDGFFPYGGGVRLERPANVLVVSRGPNRKLDGPGGDDVQTDKR
jgi:hypothetical protein